MRLLVAGWKERGLRRLADDAAAVMAERLPHPGDAVAHIRAARSRPPPPARLSPRRAARLARSRAHWSLPCEPLLTRSGRSLRQRGLSLPERRRNVAGAFRAACRVRRTVVLVDDVYTSGATVHAAASALRAAGARRVDVVTFARALRADSADRQ